MHVSVLGPVAVLRDEGHADLGGRLQRLLAALVVADGSVVSVDALVDIVWPDEPPANASRSLRTYVTRLRQALDADRDDVIEFHQPGYAIGLVPDELDSRAFEDDLDRALSCLRTADAGTAMELLVTALGRWRGEAYASFAHEEWARPEAVRLEERRIEAREALIEARMGVGAAEQAVAEASALVEAVPLRDRSRMLLMRSLYLAGRQADALRAASDYRSYLVTETGLDPSSEVTELEGRIARGDAAVEGAVQVLHGYELHERIGEGAFAVVHRATQPELRRDVAVKVIRGELADRPDFIRRFEVEAQTVARVEHPNVVPLYDFWREPGAAFLVMRLLRGGSVEQALRAHGAYSSERVIRLLSEVGGALDAAHRSGVVHRDVRPANLLLDDDGVTYLADFGIALPTATSDDLPIASPAYAAPEVLRGEPAGGAADVLSLGVTVFELLTGRLPFADVVDRAEIIRRQMHEPLPPVSATRTDLAADVDAVLARATAKAPGDRHASVVALVADLQAALDGAPTARRPVTATSGVVENPYVGLHAFTEQDSARYFGREALAAELVEAVDRHRLVVVVGASGAGKSSAVRAGLLPAIRRGAVIGSDSWFVTAMLPGSDPIDALETALLRVAVNPPVTLRAQLDQRGGLMRAIRRVLPDERTQILIVIDQFEELFTQVADSEERDRFLSELSAAITAPGSPLRVVATLRADHFDAPLRHREMAELFTAGTVAITPMSPEDLERAITLPARSVGVDVEPALVADLVANASGSPNVLPLMQFVLTEMFDRRVADVMLHETYLELGGITGAMAVRADRIVETGDDADVEAARRLFGRLVTLGEGTADTRRRALRSELGTDERAEALVDEFVAARLLATDRDPASRAPTIEVAHEALLQDWPRLRGWLDEDRADLHTLRRITAAAGAWRAAERDPSELARGGRLDAARELADRRPEWLNEGESEWLAASLAAVEAEQAREAAAIARDRRQNRRLRQLLGVAAVLLIVASVAAVGALVLQNRAAEERDRAEALILVASSDAVDDGDPELATMLALVAAERLGDDLQAETALRRSLQASRTLLYHGPVNGTEQSGELFSSDLTPDGTRVAIGALGGQVVVRDVDSGDEIWSLALLEDPGLPAMTSVRFINGGEELAVGIMYIGVDDRTVEPSKAGVHLLDAESGEALSSHPIGTCGAMVDSPGSSSDSHVLILANDASWEADHHCAVLDDNSSRFTQMHLFDVGSGATSTIGPVFDSQDGFRAFAAMVEPANRHVLYRPATPGEAEQAGGDQGVLEIFASDTNDLLTYRSMSDEAGSLALSPDGATVAVGGTLGQANGRIEVLDADTGEGISTLDGHRGATVIFLDFLDGDSTLLSVDSNGTVNVWRLGQDAPRSTIEIGGVAAQVAARSDDGARVAIGGRDQARVIAIADLAEIGTIETCDGVADFHLTGGVAVEGGRALTRTVCGGVVQSEIFEYGRLERLAHFDAGNGQGGDLTSDGRFLAEQVEVLLNGSGPALAGPVHVTDLATGESVEMTGLCAGNLATGVFDDECRMPPDEPYAAWAEEVYFSPDGRRVAMGTSRGGPGRVWDAATGRTLHVSPFVRVAFSPDGSRIVTMSLETLTYEVRDTSTFGVVAGRTLEVGEQATRMDFTKDGSMVVMTTLTDIFRFDAATLENVGDPVLNAHEAWIRDLDISDDGTMLATAGSDGLVKVWSMPDLDLLHEIEVTSSDRVQAVAFGGDDRHVVASTPDGPVRIYTLDRDELLDIARSRLLREFTPIECDRYFPGVDCPTLADLRAG